MWNVIFKGELQWRRNNFVYSYKDKFSKLIFQQLIGSKVNFQKENSTAIFIFNFCMTYTSEIFTNIKRLILHVIKYGLLDLSNNCKTLHKGSIWWYSIIKNTLKKVYQGSYEYRYFTGEIF